MGCLQPTWYVGCWGYLILQGLGVALLSQSITAPNDVGQSQRVKIHLTN
jgi:hypothetical protein